MIDISGKQNQLRNASARGLIKLKKETVQAINENNIKKGNVPENAKIAGIMAAKSTPSILPHCHPIPLEKVNVDVNVLEDEINVTCEVSATYKTGVEMEALTCVSASLLTVWDMVKYLEKDVRGQYPNTRIENISVIKKSKEDP